MAIRTIMTLNNSDNPLRNLLIAGVCVSVLLVSGCSENQKPGQTVGVIAGSIIGALVGSQIGGGAGNKVAIALGAAAGAMVGGTLGAELDEQDRMRAQTAVNDALESAEEGESVSWANPDSGNEGSYTPTETFETSEGLTCRDFSQTVVIEEEEEETTGTACKQPDGTWHIVG